MKLQAFAGLLCRVFLPAALTAFAAATAALDLPGPLVGTGWLAENQGEVVILDVRKDAGTYLGQPPAADEKPDLKKLTGHIPGAVSVPWKRVIAKGDEQGVTLKAMLPTPEAFAELMRESGVGTDSAVVIAGRGLNAKDQAYAARLYFTLKYFGHDGVALLDGGTAQWAHEGRPLAYTPETPQPGDFAVTRIRHHLVADTADVEEAVTSGDVQLVDCRTEDFYLGLTHKRGFVPPEQQGHLPGAKTLPFMMLSDNSGPAKLYTPEQMRDVARLKGVDLTRPTISYCNTGVTASLGWLTLHELLGNEQTRLYDGSLHAWSTLVPEHGVVTLAQAVQDTTAADASPTRGADAALQAAPGSPPRSLQTLVDERRDTLRRRRNDFFDALSGRHFYQPAWMARREAMVDDYRDDVRAAHRQHRDTLHLYHDAVRGGLSPWTRAHRDWAEIRSFVNQMEQLDRREALDNLRFTHAYVPW